MTQKLIIILLFAFPFLCLSQKKSGTKINTTLSPSALRGKLVYAQHCLACHQADGSGVPNMNPPLIRTKWVMGSKTVLIHQVLKGSSGKVEIDGDRFHNTMPPIPTLSDQEIADVLTYVRSNFKNKFSPVSVAEVKAERLSASK